MTPAERAAAIARCDREIERIENTHDEPAWLVAMGRNDWEMEKDFLLNKHALQPLNGSYPTVETGAVRIESQALDVISGEEDGAQTAPIT